MCTHMPVLVLVSVPLSSRVCRCQRQRAAGTQAGEGGWRGEEVAESNWRLFKTDSIFQLFVDGFSKLGTQESGHPEIARNPSITSTPTLRSVCGGAVDLLPLAVHPVFVGY